LSSPRLIAVVTTIQAPTPAMGRLATALADHNGQFLIAADRKGPSAYPLAGAQLLTLQDQLDAPLRLPGLLPFNHYVRKNAAYLVAISRRPSCIYETDDDNAPNDNWKPRLPKPTAIPVTQPGWYNVYRHFSSKLIWPRGFPLEFLGTAASSQAHSAKPLKTHCPIQQGLADGSPDVDAIWRLVLPDDVRFLPRRSLALGRGSWCPFNSQSTWWWPEVYPLLYLPSYCTFRMTDIWRSFVAQRCVWELGGSVAFHAPEVVQDRNKHNLLHDFRDEVPGYLNNAKIGALLDGLSLKPGADNVPANLLACYQFLAAQGVVPKKELKLLSAWLADLRAISKGLVL